MPGYSNATRSRPPSIGNSPPRMPASNLDDFTHQSMLDTVLVLQRKVRHVVSLLLQPPSWKEKAPHARRDCSRHLSCAQVQLVSTRCGRTDGSVENLSYAL